MSAAHTLGRVTFKEGGDANHWTMLAEDGRWLLALMHNGEAMSATQAENFRRLAACWNACDGLSTEALERGPKPAEAFEREQDRADKAEIQRDELLEALRAGPSIEHALPFEAVCKCSQCEFVRLRRAAIAKATGAA